MTAVGTGLSPGDLVPHLSRYFPEMKSATWGPPESVHREGCRGEGRSANWPWENEAPRGAGECSVPGAEEQGMFSAG